MAKISVTHTIGDLQSDCRKIATGARKDMAQVVRRNAKTGNTIAKSLAEFSAGKHGKHYPKSFRVGAVSSYYGFGGGEIAVEYGPLANQRQGGMSFEYGSRNQPPHLDLNKSADLIGPQLAKDAGNLLDSLFWPNS
jgi:hypothetical protein